MKFSRQTTLRAQATVAGVGVHSGLPVTLTLGPASVDAGFVFVRTGLEGCDREVLATAEQVIATEFATVLGDRSGPLVSTAEHVLAALRGMGVDNATIEIDGPEVPIMDGSAAAFIAAIDQAGIVSQPAQRRFIQVLKPISAKVGDSFGEIRPYANGFRVDIEIDFTNPVIGQQSYGFDLSPERFRREVGRARTFGLMGDVARLWSAGYALGASFENTVVFDDEFVRHKILDAIGDLYLVGYPLLASYVAHKSGHGLNNLLLRELLAHPESYEIVSFDSATSAPPSYLRQAVQEWVLS